MSSALEQRQTQLGRADSSATGSSSTTRSSSTSAPTNNVLHSPSTTATTAESAVQSPIIKPFSPPPQSGFKQQTHPTPQAPFPNAKDAKPPEDDALEPHNNSSSWNLRGVMRLARWVKGNGGSNTSAGIRKQQVQRPRPLRPKKPPSPNQPASTDATPPLPSPVNHRRATFDIVTPLLPVPPGPSEFGVGASSGGSSTVPQNNSNNVTASATLPQIKFPRGLSLIEALDDVVPSSTPSPPPAVPFPTHAAQSISSAGPGEKKINGRHRSRTQGTFHNNVNAQLRPSTAPSGRDPIAEEAAGDGAPPPPPLSKLVRLDERTTTVFAGGVVILSSDASGSRDHDGSSSSLPPAGAVRNAPAGRAPKPRPMSTPTRPQPAKPAAPSQDDDVPAAPPSVSSGTPKPRPLSTPTRPQPTKPTPSEVSDGAVRTPTAPPASARVGKPRPMSTPTRPKPTKPTPSQVDDEDDVFLTASSRESRRQQQQQHRHHRPDELGFTTAYIDEDDEDDDDEYEYNSPKVWGRISGMDRVHARRERRRLGVSGFRNSMQFDGAEYDDGGSYYYPDDEKAPRDLTGTEATSAASSVGERVVVAQFEEAPKNNNGQVIPPTSQPTPRQRPRPPRPLPPIPIVGLPHIRLSTGGDDDGEKDPRRSLTDPRHRHNVVPFTAPSSTAFSHSQGVTFFDAPPAGLVGTRKRAPPLSAASDARLSVVSAEWVKVEADAGLVGEEEEEEVQVRGGRMTMTSFGKGGGGKKSYSEVGHASAGAPSSSNRFLFPFFPSPASEEEEDRSSSLHTTAVDHRFFPFPQTAATDIGHAGDVVVAAAAAGSPGGKRDSFLLRSKSARLPHRVSMIGSDSGHGHGSPSPGRRKSKKAIISAVGDGPAVRRKASAGTLLVDRLMSSFGLKKVSSGGDGETEGGVGGGGGFFGSGKGKEKEKQQLPPPRSSTPRPATPVREIRLDDDIGEVTPSSKPARRKSVLVKKRPSAAPEGLEKGNPKSRSTTSLGLGKDRRGSATPRPSMGGPENIPLPGSPGSGTMESVGDSTCNPAALAGTPNSLNRKLTGKWGRAQKRRPGGSLGSALELGVVGSLSDNGHSQGHSRVASEAGGRRRGASGSGIGFMAGFLSGLSMTSIVSSSMANNNNNNNNRSPPSPKGGKLTKPNPMAANQPTTWSPSYGLGRGHSASSSTFFGGGSAAPTSMLNVTEPPTPESPYVGLSESPGVSTVPLRSVSPSPLANAAATPRRSSTSLLFATPKALRRISEVPIDGSPASIMSLTAENVPTAPGEVLNGWMQVKPRKSMSSLAQVGDDDIPPVPPIPASLASQILVPIPPPAIPGRRPLPPPPPMILNPDSVHKKAPLVSLAYTGKQGYYAHEEARLQLQREIAEEEPEMSASTTSHGEDKEQNADMTVEYPITPRLKESILRAHLYTSPSSPTAKLSNARMGSMYAFPRTESAVDEDLLLFQPKRPHLPHRQSSASAKRWTLAVNQIPDDTEFLKEIDDLRRSRQEIASASRASFRKTVEGDVAEDEPNSDGEFGEGSDEEGVWMKARRAMLTVREMMRTETSYRNHLIRLWEADSANSNPATPPTFLAHLPSLISASTLLSSRLEEDPSAWGVSAAFLGAEDALEKAFVAWCSVVGQVMLELAGNSPSISTSASRTSLYNRKSSLGARDVLDKEKPAPKRADTIASSLSSGSGTGKPNKKTKSRSGTLSGMTVSSTLSAGSKPLSVQDVAIMPSQRVPRYVLLFKDLLEQTPITSPSRGLVERALQGAMRIAKNCDDAQQHSALSIPTP